MKFAKSVLLTINCGSSSIKFALFEVGETLHQILEGGLEQIGAPNAALSAKGVNAEDNVSRPVLVEDHQTSVDLFMNWIAERSGSNEVIAIGHRIVHGGPLYHRPQQITTEMIEGLRGLSPFDPEHMPTEILLIEACRLRFSNVPQVACFDTEFHHDLPNVTRLLPIPRRYETKGVRRYGFHGLSYTFLMEELRRCPGSKASDGRVILAHLGSGASLAAVRDGKCIDTSMALTPVAGLMMGTRSGDLDPGLQWYLARTDGLDAKGFNEMINFESGLQGVSETSADIRDLLARESQDERAADAVEMFCYQAKKWIGGFAAALGGLDILVFAGGIGENSATIRTRVCNGLGFIGIDLDEKRNTGGEELISTDDSRVSVRVIRTDEQRVIAKAVCRVLGVGSQLKD